MYVRRFNVAAVLHEHRGYTAEVMYASTIQDGYRHAKGKSNTCSLSHTAVDSCVNVVLEATFLDFDEKTDTTAPLQVEHAPLSLTNSLGTRRKSA